MCVVASMSRLGDRLREVMGGPRRSTCVMCMRILRFFQSVDVCGGQHV